tara:strand:- start:197 stop:484 length:288 start_codon:yes stop_codon:yes gene_type:complete
MRTINDLILWYDEARYNAKCWAEWFGVEFIDSDWMWDSDVMQAYERDINAVELWIGDRRRTSLMTLANREFNEGLPVGSLTDEPIRAHFERIHYS